MLYIIYPLLKRVYFISNSLAWKYSMLMRILFSDWNLCKKRILSSVKLQIRRVLRATALGQILVGKELLPLLVAASFCKWRLALYYIYSRPNKSARFSARWPVSWWNLCCSELKKVGRAKNIRFFQRQNEILWGKMLLFFWSQTRRSRAEGEHDVLFAPLCCSQTNLKVLSGADLHSGCRCWIIVSGIWKRIEV